MYAYSLSTCLKDTACYPTRKKYPPFESVNQISKLPGAPAANSILIGETAEAAQKTGMLRPVKTAQVISKSNAAALMSSTAPAGVTLGVTQRQFAGFS